MALTVIRVVLPVIRVILSIVRIVLPVVRVVLPIVRCTLGVVEYTFIPYRHGLVVRRRVFRLLVSQGFWHGIFVPLSSHCVQSARVLMCRPKPGPSASI